MLSLFGYNYSVKVEHSHKLGLMDYRRQGRTIDKFITYNLQPNVRCWCKENLLSDVSFGYQLIASEYERISVEFPPAYIFFKTADDAMIFKMKWL